MVTFFTLTTLIFLVTTLLALYTVGKQERDIEQAGEYLRLVERHLIKTENKLAETIEHKKSVIDDSNKIITEMNIKNHELQSQIEQQLKDIGL